MRPVRRRVRKARGQCPSIPSRANRKAVIVGPADAHLIRTPYMPSFQSSRIVFKMRDSRRAGNSENAWRPRKQCAQRIARINRCTLFHRVCTQRTLACVHRSPKPYWRKRKSMAQKQGARQHSERRQLCRRQALNRPTVRRCRPNWRAPAGLRSRSACHGLRPTRPTAAHDLRRG